MGCVMQHVCSVNIALRTADVLLEHGIFPAGPGMCTFTDALYVHVLCCVNAPFAM